MGVGVGITLEEGTTEDDCTGTTVKLPCPITERIFKESSVIHSSFILKIDSKLLQQISDFCHSCH